MEIVTTTDMDALPPMSAGELKCQREYLGLSTAWIAEKLVIAERRIQRMESGQERIPDVIINFIDAAQKAADELVSERSAAYRRAIKAAGGASAFYPVFRTDGESAEAGLEYPSRFYRHVAARVSDNAAGTIPIFPSGFRAGGTGHGSGAASE